ncbi:hypothetical protein AA0116_g13191 [Alternaria tenuissima]|nr:hypothetical protein AA0116_g13191 [Alternaria tenuissima]
MRPCSTIFRLVDWATGGLAFHVKLSNVDTSRWGPSASVAAQHHLISRAVFGDDADSDDNVDVDDDEHRRSKDNLRARPLHSTKRSVRHSLSETEMPTDIFASEPADPTIVAILENGTDMKLAVTFETRPALLRHLPNGHDACAPTADLHGDNCHKELACYDGCSLTGPHQQNKLSSITTHKRYDAAALTVAFLLFNVALFFSHLQILHTKFYLTSLFARVPNDPLPRPPPKPLGTGPRQSHAARPTKHLASFVRHTIRWM